MKSRKKGIILVLSVILIFSIGLLVNNLMTNNKDTAKPKKKTVAAVKKKKETPPKPKEPFNIDFTGDIMFDWDLRPVLAEKGMDYPFNNVREELKSSDYTFVDLETAITTRTKKKSPTKNFGLKVILVL